MKKTLIIIAMVLGTVCCTWAGKPSEISALARQYGSKDGFEVVSMGRVLISALGVAASMDNDLDAEDRAALEEEIPAGRFGTAEETAQVILMLAEGPEYLTGQVVTVSGGWQI